MKLRAAAVTAVGTVLIYLGLPLLGWGVLDLPAFFASGARAAFAAAIVAFGLAAGWQTAVEPAGVHGSRGDLTKLVRRQTVVGSVMVAVMFAGLLLLPLADRAGVGVLAASEVTLWTGAVLWALGLALVFWSGLALGKMYSAEVTIQKDHRLITTGLYRYLRHPRYLGNLLLYLGASLVFRSWIGLAVFPLFFALILARIFDEEALMHREFGAEWEAYRTRSWRMIPFVF